MNVAFRIVVVFVVVVATFYFIFWVPFSFFDLPEDLDWVRSVGSLVCALASGWYVWTSSDYPAGSRTASAVRGAILVGSVGLFVGFFGPLVFAPGSNQGPLLGLLFLGPLGFMLGGIGGYVYGSARRRRSRTTSGLH